MTNKAYLSINVIFNEESFPIKDQATSHLPSKINAQGDAPIFLYVSILIANDISHALYTFAATENPNSPTHTPELSDLTPTSSSLPTLDPTPIQPEPTSDPNPEPPSPPPTHHMITRSRINSHQKSFLTFSYITPQHLILNQR